MYTVVIVDDEKIIVEGLQKMFKRYIPNCQVIGVGYDGDEGYHVIREIKPDIVVTDIRMPNVIGHEMIRKLKEDKCQSRFIILSGYTEFEYAKKAMEMGVKHYIIKPVDEDELSESVEKVIHEIELEKKKEQEIQELHDTIKDNMQNLRHLVLCDVVDEGSKIDNHIKYLLRSVDFPIDNQQYVCSILEINMDEHNNVDLISISKYMRKIIVYDEVNIFTYAHDQLGIIISSHKKVNYSTIIESFKTIKYNLLKEYQLNVSIGIGNIYDSINGLSQSFEEARYAVRGKIIKGNNQVITYSEINNINNDMEIFSQDNIEKIEKCINNMNYDECVHLVDDLFEKIMFAPNVNISDLQHYCLNIILFAIRKISPMQIQLNRVLGKNILSIEEISRFRTLDEVKNWLNNVLRSMIDIRVMYNIPKEKDLISQVKEYIVNHINENISLAIIADKVFVNPYYLSQLFKEKTGETYLNFVMKIRINKAKELLKKTKLKVYEICELIGYTDVNHFTRIFQRFEGCTPTQYRKKSKKD